MGVAIQAGATFAAGAPGKVLAGAYVAPLNGRTYDVSPDGRRFLMIKEVDQGQTSSTQQIVVVQNWFEELRRRVPTP